MSPAYAMELAEYRASLRRRLAIGVGIGLLIAAGTWWLSRTPPLALAADAVMEKACGYPRYPGEALMIGIDEKGETKCWKLAR